MGIKTFQNKILLNEAQVLTANFQSPALDTIVSDNIGIIIDCTSITSDQSGTFTIQVRNLVKDSPQTWTSWSTLTLDDTIQLLNTDTSFSVSLNQVPFDQVRVNFVSSGTEGVCDIVVCKKNVGGN